MPARRSSSSRRRHGSGFGSPHRGHDNRSLGGDRKTMQLCQQIGRALNDALAGSCNDDLLRGLFVESVQPAPDASRLLVTVRSLFNEPVNTIQVLQRLEEHSGLLRSEAASAITRRKVPLLFYQVAQPAPPAAPGSQLGS